MAETQFFKRENSWLEDYKSNFKMALNKVKIVRLFSIDILEFLEKWIEIQTSYITREDVDNFLPNMNLIFENKNFYDFTLKRLENINSNWNILEYSFNLISELEEAKKDFEKNEEERIRKETLNIAELESKNEDKKKLKEIEEVMNDL